MRNEALEVRESFSACGQAKSLTRCSGTAATASFCCLECGPLQNSDHAIAEVPNSWPSRSHHRMSAKLDFEVELRPSM